MGRFKDWKEQDWKAEVRPELEKLMVDEIEARGVPSSIDFVTEMPHTGMGKIDYLKLAKDYDARMDAEAGGTVNAG